ncbi:amidase [Leucobacter exalbidus]|uniref:Amidase n=1 Tax=Leucobacter exalbidus TaxID=662960 RepID=A0A940T130_9MICO|nr:amidase [Leucobacter exalbidus]MBP1326460.1 amidase [Leucobacter exalbidus]
MSETLSPRTAKQLPESAYVLREALRHGEVTSREIVERSLARIEAWPALGAFTTVTAESALAEADAADRILAADRIVADPSNPNPATGTLEFAPLRGLPLAYKDLLDVAGTPTTRGSAALPHPIAKRDDAGVAVLRTAGAISLGKTQVPEFGLNSYSENLIAPPARNPLDPSRTPGGSSGGIAAAVAAGLVPMAPGTDGGGSIRIPALACGLVGLKPGLGSIPSDVIDGVTDEFGAPKLTVSGPIARDALDAAMLYDAMRVKRAEPSVAAVRGADGLLGLRVGVSFASPFAAAHPTPISPEERAAVETAAAILEARGHTVEDADLAYDPRYPEVFGRAWTAGLSLLKLNAEAESRLTTLTRTFRDRALARTTAEHEAAGAELSKIGRGMREAWGAYDVILTPGLAFAPPRIGDFMALDADGDYQMQCEWTPFTSMVNVAGLPAIAVPVQTLPSGLSVGVQLIGGPGREPRLLQLAAQLMG